MNRSASFLEVREPIGRQRQQCCAFDLIEEFADLLLGRSVNACVGNRLLPLKQVFILSGQSLELAPFQGVVLGIFDPVFDLAFVLWLIGPGGENYRAVVLGQRL